MLAAIFVKTRDADSSELAMPPITPTSSPDPHELGCSSGPDHAASVITLKGMRLVTRTSRAREHRPADRDGGGRQRIR